MIHGILYGSLLTIVIYFAVFAIRLRNITAMWHTFFIICIGLFLGSFYGDIQNLLKLDLSHENQIVLAAIIGLLYFSGFKFFRIFFNTGFFSSSIDRIIHVFQWMGICFIPVQLMPNPFTQAFGLILFFAGPLFSIGAIILFRVKNIFNPGYFTIGWIFVHASLSTLLLNFFHINEQVSGSFLLLPGMLMASIIFFSIAVINQNQRFYENSLQDNLTGMASRRLFDQALSIEWNRSLRNQKPLSLIMGDIDNFKAFNKTYGQALGDECLKAVARVFDKSLRRAGDMTARYGGEEFIAVLPDTSASEAGFLAEKIRSSVEKMAIKHDNSSTGKIITISLGTATIIPNAEKMPKDIILTTDKAVYQAKINGRNRVISIISDTV